MFKYSNDNKRYHTFSYYLKKKYGHKVAKLSLDGGFTCPNRDGKVGTGGCHFCGDEGAGENAGDRAVSIKEQLAQQKVVQLRKWPTAKFIAYFQAFTNTYTSVENLKALIDPILEDKDIVAISLGTRADCLEDDMIAYLSSLTEKLDIWLEIGLQTIHKDTFNRCYDLSVFDKVMTKLNASPINTCVHVINGLPDETQEDMIATAKYVSDSGIDAIKIHSLFINSGTTWGDEYEKGDFKCIDRDLYIDTTIKQLQHIRPEIVVQRLTGDPDRDTLLAPLWSVDKRVVSNDIDKLMAKNNVCQGDIKK